MELSPGVTDVLETILDPKSPWSWSMPESPTAILCPEPSSVVENHVSTSSDSV